MRQLLACAIVFGAATATMAEPTAQEIAKMQEQLLAETQVVAVQGVKVLIKDFKSDGDPKTLEIAFLAKKQPGMNSVSDDGEVIFLFKPSDDLQSELIGKAFELRARRRLEATPAAK
jgi:hypothetical protein